MSDVPPGDSPDVLDTEKPTAPADSAKSSSTPSTSPRWPTFAALAIALIALALAIVGWVYPRSPGGASHNFSGQQVNDAKTHICTAYQSVHEAVVSNTHLENPVENDPIGQIAVATSARLTLYAGGAYLRQRVTAEPATPADLAKSVNDMANTLEELSIGYLAGLSATLDPLRHDFDSEIEAVDKICK